MNIFDQDDYKDQDTVDLHGGKINVENQMGRP